MTFGSASSPSQPRGEAVAEDACGAIHFEALFPDRIHRCDLPRGHEDPTQHSQWHARTGACGAPYCAGTGWRDRSADPDPIAAAIDRLCRTLDDLYATLTGGHGKPQAGDDPRQLCLFPRMGDERP
jgi:hypothetical protein